MPEWLRAAIEWLGGLGTAAVTSGSAWLLLKLYVRLWAVKRAKRLQAEIDAFERDQQERAMPRDDGPRLDTALEDHYRKRAAELAEELERVKARAQTLEWHLDQTRADLAEEAREHLRCKAALLEERARLKQLAEELRRAHGDDLKPTAPRTLGLPVVVVEEDARVTGRPPPRDLDDEKTPRPRGLPPVRPRAK